MYVVICYNILIYYVYYHFGYNNLQMVHSCLSLLISDNIHPLFLMVPAPHRSSSEEEDSSSSEEESSSSEEEETEDDEEEDDDIDEDALDALIDSVVDYENPNECWDLVRTWLWDHCVNETKRAVEIKGEFDTTALHVACRNRPPVDVVDIMLMAAPDMIFWADSFGWLPVRVVSWCCFYVH